MRLVKRVACKLQHIVPNFLRNVFFIAVCLRATHPVIVGCFVFTIFPVKNSTCEQGNLLFCHRFTNTRVAFALRKTAHLYRNLHNLLLVHNSAVGFVQNLRKAVVVKHNRLAAIHTVNVAGNHTCTQRTGTIQRNKSNNLAKLARLHIFNGCRHAFRLNLKHACRMTRAKQLINGRIAKINLCRVDINRGCALFKRRFNGGRKRVYQRQIGVARAYIFKRF